MLDDDQRPLRERTDRAIAHAAELLGEPHRPVGELSTAVQRLIDRLAELGVDSPRVRDQLAARDRLHARYARRFQALADAAAAVEQVRELTAPPTILSEATAALCAGGAFHRALLSVVEQGRMTPHALHVREDPATAHQALSLLSERSISLEHPLVEAEVVRRRRATIVSDASTAQVDPGWQAVMRWRSYVAAPLVAGSTLIGVIHADHGAASAVDILDRDVLWEFTTALAQVYERAMLHRQLRHEREQLRAFLDWLGARSGELTDAPVRLSTFQRSRRSPLTPDAVPGGPVRDDRSVFDGLLTRRELEVLRLLAEGRSNRSIAEALTISPSTVKFHVNRILRHLHVTNRSQAVARYLRLVSPSGS